MKSNSSEDLSEASSAGELESVNKASTSEEIARLMKPKHIAKLDSNSIIVNSDQVRYYFNKTQDLKVPLRIIMESFAKLHNCAFAYLSQVPISGDYSIISTLFELIPVISTTIDWEAMNHTCYWNDFCRETKQLMELVEKTSVAASKCGDTATDMLLEAQDIFRSTSTIIHPLTIQRATDFRLTAVDNFNEEPDPQTIQLSWKKPGERIELAWHDADGGLLKVFLKHTGTGFRLRFLRHIIYHARSCLELAYLTFMKVNVSLCLDIPLGKLQQCQRIPVKHLTPQEQSLVGVAKREFDASLDSIWVMVSRFKFQVSQLLKYKPVFKGLQKSWLYVPEVEACFSEVKMNLEDSLLMRVMSCGIPAQTKEESFDFTVFPDRTEDITSIVEDLLPVDYVGYKELHLLWSIIKIVLPSGVQHFATAEMTTLKDDISLILAHRQRIRRYIKQSVTLFQKNSAFQKMNLHHMFGSLHSHRLPVTSPSLKEQSETEVNDSVTASESYIDRNDTISNNGKNVGSAAEEDQLWITIPGDICVTISPIKGVILQFANSQEMRSFHNLSTEEKIVITCRLMRYLLSVLANEQCWMKILSRRVTEAKSLVKRLKMKDRLSDELQKSVLEQYKYLRLLLQLTKNMRYLKTIF